MVMMTMKRSLRVWQREAKEFIDSGAEVYTIGQKDENNT